MRTVIGPLKCTRASGASCQSCLPQKGMLPSPSRGSASTWLMPTSAQPPYNTSQRQSIPSKISQMRQKESPETASISGKINKSASYTHWMSKWLWWLRECTICRRNVIRILELITYPDQEGRPNMLSKKLSTEDLQQNFSNLWIDFFWLLGRDSNVEIYKRGEAMRTKFKTK